MEAKETVERIVKYTIELFNLLDNHEGDKHQMSDDWQIWESKVLQEAEISFKAGMGQGIQNEKSYRHDDYKAGIKEVVVKIDKMIIGLKAICLPSEQRLMNELEREWLKLKEWGIVDTD